MSRNRKTVYKGFSYLQCDDFAAYLGRMAEQGWHFREWKAGLVFEKGEPEKAEYAVEVFIDGSEYDTRPEVHTKEFAAYCEAAGWQMVDAKRKFVIFRKTRPDAADILTDEERLDNICSELRRSIQHSLILSAVWSCMMVLEYSTISFANNIFSNTSLLVAGFWLMLLINSIGKMIHFNIWKNQLRSRIRRGESVYFGRERGSGTVLLPFFDGVSITGCVLYLIGFWYFGQTRMVLFFLGYLAVILVMGYLIARFRPETNTNAIIQTIIPSVLFVSLLVISLYQVYDSHADTRSEQQIPLYAEDIGLDFGEMENSTGYVHSSVFGTHTAYSLHYENRQYMFYVAYKTNEDWILDRIWELETDGAANRNRTDCTEAWGAEIGFRNENGDFFLRYPNSILTFTLYDETQLSDVQIAVILDKLELR